jgi:hypothetical protein
MDTCWLHPHVTVRASPIEGRGLFADAPIAAGAVVVRLRGREVTGAELHRIFAEATGYVDTISIDEDRHLVLAPGQPVHFGNHSCDPSLWHADAYTLVARRGIAGGEEITVDYATQTAEPDFRMECYCGTPACRGTVTGADWRDPAWQARYRGHVVPAVARLVARSAREP